MYQPGLLVYSVHCCIIILGDKSCIIVLVYLLFGFIDVVFEIYGFYSCTVDQIMYYIFGRWIMYLFRCTVKWLFLLAAFTIRSDICIVASSISCRLYALAMRGFPYGWQICWQARVAVLTLGRDTIH